ncbi:MAG TPA: hypothetical protein VKA32_05425, partial [Gammaproteobacteria bacterium]|nr:hypothetical protein [Gammaproteobacteria bacterium]
MPISSRRGVILDPSPTSRYCPEGALAPNNQTNNPTRKTMTLPLQTALLFATGALAGVINVLAGGGS